MQRVTQIMQRVTEIMQRVTEIMQRVTVIMQRVTEFMQRVTGDHVRSRLLKCYLLVGMQQGSSTRFSGASMVYRRAHAIRYQAWSSQGSCNQIPGMEFAGLMQSDTRHGVRRAHTIRYQAWSSQGSCNRTLTLL